MRTEITHIDEWNNDTIEITDIKGCEYTCIDIESFQQIFDAVLDGQDKYIISVIGYYEWYLKLPNKASDLISECLNNYPYTKSLFKIG